MSVPEIVDEVLATKPPCSILAFEKTAAPAAVVARVLVDAARRAACARSQPLATYLAALAPGAAPDPAVAAALRDGIRASLDAAQGDEVIDPGAGGRARRGRPRARSGAPRDAAAGQRRRVPAADVAAPSGPDQIGAQLALRTFVGRRLRPEDAGRAAGRRDLRDGSAARRGEGRGIDEARAEQAIRAGLATAADGLQKDKVLSSTGADAIKALSRVVPADRLLLAVQGADDACAPLTWQTTNGVQDMAAELVLYGVMGAACESGLSVLAVAEALTGDAPPAALEEPLRRGMLAGVDAAEKAGAIGAIRAFALRQTIGNVPIYEAIGIIRDRL